jgi:hypothetical protein
VSQPTGVALRFKAFFTKDGEGVEGLTVTVDVYKRGASNTKAVDDAAATEVGGGFYEYVASSSIDDQAGDYLAAFKTAGDVDQAHVPGLQEVAAWVDQIVARLDATISSRLASGSYTAPPSTGAIADAVFDEALAGHVIAGSAGAALGAAGAAADPLASAVPGAYAVGTAGAAIAAIKAKTDAISIGDLTIASPFDPSSNRLTLVRGDDYPADHAGAIPPFTSSDWPDLTGSTEIRLTVRARPIPPDTDDPVLFTLTDTTGVRVDGPGEQSVTFEPLSAPGDPVLHGQEGGTADLIPGRARAKWDIQATLSDGTVRTLALGLVDVLEDQTREA